MAGQRPTIPGNAARPAPRGAARLRRTARPSRRATSPIRARPRPSGGAALLAHVHVQRRRPARPAPRSRPRGRAGRASGARPTCSRVEVDHAAAARLRRASSRPGRRGAAARGSAASRAAPSPGPRPAPPATTAAPAAARASPPPSAPPRRRFGERARPPRRPPRTGRATRGRRGQRALRHEAGRARPQHLAHVGQAKASTRPVAPGLEPGEGLRAPRRRRGRAPRAGPAERGRLREARAAGRRATRARSNASRRLAAVAAQERAAQGEEREGDEVGARRCAPARQARRASATASATRPQLDQGVRAADPAAALPFRVPHQRGRGRGLDRGALGGLGLARGEVQVGGEQERLRQRRARCRARHPLPRPLERGRARGQLAAGQVDHDPRPLRPRWLAPVAQLAEQRRRHVELLRRPPPIARARPGGGRGPLRASASEVRRAGRRRPTCEPPVLDDAGPRPAVRASRRTPASFARTRASAAGAPPAPRRSARRCARWAGRPLELLPLPGEAAPAPRAPAPRVRGAAAWRARRAPRRPARAGRPGQPQAVAAHARGAAPDVVVVRRPRPSARVATPTASPIALQPEERVPFREGEPPAPPAPAAAGAPAAPRPGPPHAGPRPGERPHRARTPPRPAGRARPWAPVSSRSPRPPRLLHRKAAERMRGRYAIAFARAVTASAECHSRAGWYISGACAS